jgi:regulator of sirC expression with transglutaminase-like and TPR domain
MLALPDDAVDLAHASLLVACEEYPDLDVDRYVSRLDTLAGELRARVSTAAEPAILASALSRLLVEEEGFRGNTRDYYDPRNSFLNDVLDRKTGIPITLAMVYMEVARRAGVAIDGVGLPGHFIVKLPGRDSGLLMDPFHGGALLSIEDCQARLDRIYEGRLKIKPSMLAPCGRKEILARMLRNLKAIYTRAGDYPRALRIVDLLLRVDPGNAQELRDRGLLHAALDCYALAASDLEAVLERAPGSPDAAALEKRIEDLRRRAARLN